MKKNTILALIAGILTIAAGSTPASTGGQGADRVSNRAARAAGKTPGLKVDFGKIPLYFIANKGQVDGRASFYAKAARYNLWLTKDGFVFDSFKARRPEDAAPAEGPAAPPDRRGNGPIEMERDVSRLVFLNASENPDIVPLDPAPLKVNYFLGGDPDKWRTAVPTFGAVLYKDVYDRIDLKVYGIESRIEYDWIVRPGGDPSDIAFDYTQVRGTRVDAEGNLMIETRFGELQHQKPIAYQGVDRSPVVSAFKTIGENAYGFEVGPYDRDRDLVIDPVVLAYSTYLGGSGAEKAYDIAADGSGRVYVTGYTDSANFPTLGSYQTDLGLRDVFVAMLDTTQAGAASLLYATYLGGSGTDVGTGIALDANGYVYATGHTNSTDFPTFHHYQADQAGADAFVVKLDPAQSGAASLLFSTYLGGSGNDYGWGIAADASGCAYVTGDQDSTDFPTLVPFQTDQPQTDVFVTKLDTTKSGAACLLYSTYLGGSLSDFGYGIATDGIGNAYVTGYTVSSDFPTLNPYQTDQGVRDVFVTRLNTTKTGAASLTYSTLLGGSDDDYGMRIQAVGNGLTFVAGFTDSTDFPTINPYQTDPGDGTSDVFLAKVDTSQSGAAGLVYATYIGGSGADFGYSVAVDSGGVATVTGTTRSTNYPTANAYQTDPGDAASDAFVTRIDPSGIGPASLLYSTYLGGSATDEGQGIAMDSSGNVYVAGFTDSSGFPTLNPYQTDQSGTDGFVTKIYDNGLAESLTVTAPNGGESWEAGSSHFITWTTTGSVGNVRIEYSADNGGSWTDVAASTPNDGTHPWTVPGALTAQGRIRIGQAAGGTPSDQSNAAFSIVAGATITVTSPNGGESWDVGSAHDVTWTSTGTVADVRIEYSTNNGGAWTDIATSTPNDGTHSWTVPNAVSQQCLIRITRLAGGAPSDSSDAVFAIAALPALMLTSPNGGESWTAGSLHDITWTSTGTVGNVRIEYSTNNGGAWTDIAASTANDGTHSWTVPGTLTAQGLIRISQAAGGAPSDVSDAVFSVIAAPTITVTSPNGGEEWIVASAHDLTWTSTGGIANAKIEYSTNGGTDWTTIVASTANDGSHSWTVVNAPSTSCLVRVSEAGGPATDASDAVFSIGPPPTIALNRSRLNYGALGGTTTSAQSVTINNTGGLTPHWTATPSTGWITATPGSGTGAATVTIGVDPTGLSTGAYSGTVAFADPSATNSPQSVTVYLTVYDATQPPVGDFATPTDGATGVVGAIPVTGWVLDDIETTKVEIWRDPVTALGELNSLYFIGNGLFVEGPRPDIEAGYPASPRSYAAGWGYMLLTNFLPNHGNGTYKLYAIATDKEGNQITLGTKTITCDNANATKPFGTIDTPGQGGTASGSGYINFGWVLTPLTGTVPKDGHTITVYVNGVALGNLSTPPNLYNAYRADVSTNFPGLNNTGGPGAGEGGPIGAFFINTLNYANGVHSIFWIAYDDLGRGEGIGSRFFTIANVGGSPEPALAPPATDPSLVPTSFSPVPVRTGLDRDAEFLPRVPGPDGVVRIEIPEVSRVEIMLGAEAGAEAAAFRPNGARFSGYMIVGNELRPLPVGSTLDRRAGRFSWMPGPGFVGTYDLVFVFEDGIETTRKIPVRVIVSPKTK